MKKYLRLIVILSLIIGFTLSFTVVSAQEACPGAAEGRVCGNLGYYLSTTDYTYEDINWQAALYATQNLIEYIEGLPSDADTFPFYYIEEELYVELIPDYSVLCLLNQGSSAIVSNLQSCYPTGFSQETIGQPNGCPSVYIWAEIWQHDLGDWLDFRISTYPHYELVDFEIEYVRDWGDYNLTEHFWLNDAYELAAEYRVDFFGTQYYSIKVWCQGFLLRNITIHIPTATVYG